uniref:histidine kinase n=1 Tax=Solanum tuberosum TaxID=4113 RepID=M1DE33_SOLTU
MTRHVCFCLVLVYVSNQEGKALLSELHKAIEFGFILAIALMVSLAISVVIYVRLAMRRDKREMSLSTELVNEAARQLNERTIHELPELVDAYHPRQRDAYHPSQSDVSADVIELHSTENLPLRGKKILLIEDDATSVTISQRVITSLGAVTYICRNARESVNYVSRILSEQRDVGPSTPSPPFDFIVIDCEKLRTGAFAATVCIRRDLSYYGFQIPIMALTVHSNMEAIAKISDAEMDYYLPKPLKPDLLLEAIDYMEYRKLFRRS